MDQSLQDELVAALHEACRFVYDPEFGVSIADLGLIYGITADVEGAVVVTMTLTSMYCPAGDVILSGVQAALQGIPGVSQVRVDLVWDPLWTPERLSPSAREFLGWDSAEAHE
jgi:metal-sulfur cluster biosynthetic enzyme